MKFLGLLAIFGIVGYCKALLKPNQLHYTIGGWTSSPAATMLSKWRPVFETYLTKEVGALYDPPIDFTLFPLDYEQANSVDKMIAEGKLDFAFHGAAAVACLEAQYGYTTIATQVQHTVGQDISSYGSVLYSLKANKAIKSIDDFKNKRIGVGSIWSSGSFQLPSEYLANKGLNIYTEFDQVVFYKYDYTGIMNGVIMGHIDVGAVQSDWIQANFPQNLQMFNFHNVINATFQAALHPFPTTTELVPTYGFSAAPHVPLVLEQQISDALARLNNSHPAAKGAGITNFILPESYERSRTIAERLGVLVKTPRGMERVDVFKDPKDLIVCPKGYMMEMADSLAADCRMVGRTCPEGLTCYCRPCHPDFAVQIFPWQFVLGLCCSLFAMGLCFSVGWTTAVMSSAALTKAARSFARLGEPQRGASHIAHGKHWQAVQQSHFPGA